MIYPGNADIKATEAENAVGLSEQNHSFRIQKNPCLHG